MNPRALVAVLLIAFGCVSLAYGRINFTHNKTLVDIGSVHVQQEKHETIPLPPLFGAIALASGVIVLAWPRRA
jgi:hypothetical protein